MTPEQLQAMSAEDLLKEFEHRTHFHEPRENVRAEIVRLINLARAALGGDSGASPAPLKGQRRVSLMRDDGIPTHVIPTQLHSPPVVPRLMCDCKRLPQGVHLFTDECQTFAATSDLSTGKTNTPSAPLTAEGAETWLRENVLSSNERIYADIWIRNNREWISRMAAFAASETARADRAEADLKSSNQHAEELNTALAEARKAAEWVLCADRLPEPKQVVLVRGGIAYMNHNELWYTLTAEPWPGKRIEWEVTHWRPLPSPPNPSTPKEKTT